MKVLFADDHNLVRENISFLLKTLCDTVDVLEAKNFNEALALASDAESLDLIILDMFMPGMNHFNGLIAMKDRFPDVPIVVLTGNVEMKDAFKSLELGASGYIPKTIGSKAMLNALKLILSGEKYLPTSLVFEAFNAGKDRDRQQPSPLNDLTRRELEVLSHLAEGRPNKEIARRLDLQEVTVKAHLKGVFRKLGVRNRTHAVRVLMDHGVWDRGSKRLLTANRANFQETTRY